MTSYETEQRAWWVFALAALVAAGGIVLSVSHGPLSTPEGLVGLVVVLLALVLASFGALTVRVTDEEVRWYFGPGLFGRRIPLDRIRDAEVHRSAWYWGYGIRWTPRGWLWRSSGLDAVWIELASGKRVGVGSPDPEGLRRAILERRATAAGP